MEDLMPYPLIYAKWSGGRQSRIKRIVIHGTVSPTREGQALATAQYFAKCERPSSAHYTVDPGAIYQSLPDNVIAYHDGTNYSSIGVELTDPVDGDAGRWNDGPHQQMLQRASRLVRELCHKYDIPVVRLTPREIRNGDRGICGHVDMRDAFPGSTTHYDPGLAFPWTQFLGMIVSVPPKPAPKAILEDVMYIWCQQPDKNITMGLWSGGVYIPLLTNGEQVSGRAAILKGAAEQWVEISTYNAMIGKALR